MVSSPNCLAWRDGLPVGLYFNSSVTAYWSMAATLFWMSILATMSGCEWSTSSVSAAYWLGDRKSTRLNSSHLGISYAVFCLKKKKKDRGRSDTPRAFLTQVRSRRQSDQQ